MKKKTRNRIAINLYRMANEQKFNRDLIDGTSKHIFMVALKRLKYLEPVERGEYKLAVEVNDKSIARAHKMYTAVCMEYQA
jgi:hypothetical protein